MKTTHIRMSKVATDEVVLKITHPEAMGVVEVIEWLYDNTYQQNIDQAPDLVRDCKSDRVIEFARPIERVDEEHDCFEVEIK